MKKTLGPEWSVDKIAAGQRFAANAGGNGTAPFGAGQAKVAEVLARHEAELMAYPNVVAVADGMCRNHEGTVGEACIVVYVGRILPAGQLAEKERLPKRIEGVRVKVVESGPIDTLPAQ